MFDNIHEMDNGEKMYSLGGSQSDWALLSLMHVSTILTKINTCLQPTVRRDVLPASVRTTVGEHSLPFLWHGVFRRKNGSRKTILR